MHTFNTQRYGEAVDGGAVPASAPPSLSVVVPVRNRTDLLVQTLAALARQDLSAGAFEVIVCDDGSTDDVAAVVAEFNPADLRVRLVRQPPRGPAAARNLGVRAARAEVVVFMDSDVVPAPAVLRQLGVALADHPGWCGAEAALLPSGGAQGILWTAPVSLVGGHYHTATIAYRRAVLVAVGGFDETFTLPACEDVELAVRVLEHGPVGFVPAAEVKHPCRRVDWRSHWRWRHYWRYETILAVRYGILAFPGKAAGRFPRLRVAWAAVVTLPGGRFIAGAKAWIGGARDGVTAMAHALFDVLCGLWTLPVILFWPIPGRQDYLSPDRAKGPSA